MTGLGKMFMVMVWGLYGLAHAEGPLRIVATGGRMGHNRITVSGSQTAFWHRTPHQLGGPVDEIQVGFMNWFHSYTDEVANENEVVIEHAWLERASTGQVIALMFGGGRELSMPAHSGRAYFSADPVDSDRWTGDTPARDEVFWVHARGRVPTNGKICLGTPATWTGARFIVYDPVEDPGTYDRAGEVPSISGAKAQLLGLPLVFTGRYSAPGYLSVIGLGDSILNGSGDSSRTLPAISGFGFFNRAAVDEHGENTIAMFNLTRHGATSKTWSTATRQPAFLSLANVVVEEFGTNDLGSNGTGDVEALKARLEALWARARGAGVQYVLRTRLLPRTASTDGYRTLENQTPNPGWGEGGVRDEMNAFFDAAKSEGKLDEVVHTLSPVADPTDLHFWLTDGTHEYVNADSTHLNPKGNEILGVVLRDALLSLQPDANVDTYSEWSSRVEWEGADSSPEADPNGDGVTNLEAYAYDVSPVEPVDTVDLPVVEVDPVEIWGGPWLSLVYRRNPAAGDLAYRFKTVEDLVNGGWHSVFVDAVDAVEEIVDADPDGDGTAELVRMKVKVGPEDARKFLALEIGM